MSSIDPCDGERAFQRVLRMLNASEQSSAKVRRKLERAGYGDATIEGAISRAQEHGILDDARYAEVLVRSAISQNKGFRPVRAELAELGIALEDVEAFREHMQRQGEDPASTELMRARALLDAHPPRAKNLRDAAFRKLMAKGYDVDVATEAARSWSEDHAR